jgi:hypothetical protein
MIRDIAILAFRFIAYVLLQVLVLNNIQFSGYINPYPYVLFVLTLPLWISPNWVLLIAFLLGISIDIFSGTMGLHTFATVFIAFMRQGLLAVLKPQNDYKGSEIGWQTLGFQWFIVYASIGILIHHFVLFSIESWGFTGFWHTLKITLASSFFSIIIGLIYEMFRIKSKQEHQYY